MSVHPPQPLSELTRFNLPASLVHGLDLSGRDRQTVPRGRSIIADGASPSSAFLIHEGWAVSKLSIGSGETQIIDLHGPGSLFGLNQFAQTRLSGFSETALEEVSLYALNLKALTELAGRDPDTSRWLIEKLSNQNQHQQIHTAVLGQLPARGRLAFAMLKILDVAQQQGQKMVDKPIRLPMTQEEIGNMLGLTNVSISKLMSAFRRDGLIDYGRNRVVVKDVEALSKICGVNPGALPPTHGSDYVATFSVTSAARSGR